MFSYPYRIHSSGALWAQNIFGINGMQIAACVLIKNIRYWTMIDGVNPEAMSNRTRLGCFGDIIASSDMKFGFGQKPDSLFL